MFRRWSKLYSHMPINQLGGGRSPLRAIAITIVFACLCIRSGFGLNPAKNLRQYVLRTWTSEQGLPQNSIRPILQTRDGFLWIGTRGGLARFDGAAFVIYKANTPDSIPNDTITGLAEDRDGSLWISTAGGLTRYRGGHFHNYTSRDGLPDSSIWRIAADRAGGVWAVTRHSDLFHFDGTAVRRYQSPIPALPEEVNALLEDTKGTLWIATFRGLFGLRHDGSFAGFTHKDGLAGDRIFGLALDHQGELWIAGSGGVSRYTGDGFVPMTIPGLETATLLAFDPNPKDDAIWTGSTGQGLFRVTPQGIQRMRTSKGLTSDELWLIYFSRDGSLWLGAVNGLNQLSDGAVTSYGIGDGMLKSTLGMQSSSGPNGELWFGLGSYQVYERDGKLLPMVATSEPARSGYPGHAAARDSLPNLGAFSIWVHSDYRNSRGLLLADRLGNSVLSDGTHEQPLPLIPWNSVGTMLIDRKGIIWVAGSEIGVRAYTTYAPPQSYTTTNGLDDNNAGPLAEDAAGNIWVGTISGLSVIRNGVVTHIVSRADVTSIVSSSDGSIWASSESGLIYVPPARAPVQIFTTQDNLPTSVIEGVADDNQGHLWLGTQQGIVRVNKADLLAPGAKSPGTPVVFGVGDGFRNAQVRTNSVFSSRYGDIWFITLEELATINPLAIQIKPLAPIIIDRVDIDDQKSAFAPVSSLRIPAGRHRLIIRYTLPEFRIPSRIHFRYRLEGWDKNWIEADTLRDANYTGIPPGHYTFRVANSDGYGDWNSAEGVLPIVVTPYFYQTGWFLVLVAILILIWFWELHRIRVAQVSERINGRMQERLQERTRIARELHDTLLQGMLGVSMEMYAASQQVIPHTSVASMLGHASQRLREIAEQSRKAVENLRSPSIVPDPLESMLALALRDLNIPSTMEVQINSVGSHLDLRPPIQNEIEQIAREAIANAVQHSGANMIRLDIMYQPSHFFMSITDNGCGIDQETQTLGREGHWGIAGMRERSKSIGGRLRILTHSPSGTVVEISLGAAVAYTRPQRKLMGSFWRWHLRR
jgi:ligand-binding sensor domain-containing protein/signal transduction histidine kinase